MFCSPGSQVEIRHHGGNLHKFSELLAFSRNKPESTVEYVHKCYVLLFMINMNKYSMYFVCSQCSVVMAQYVFVLEFSTLIFKQAGIALGVTNIETHV